MLLCTLSRPGGMLLCTLSRPACAALPARSQGRGVRPLLTTHSSRSSLPLFLPLLVSSSVSLSLRLRLYLSEEGGAQGGVPALMCASSSIAYAPAGHPPMHHFR
eukprot:3061207-Rhodomonas_salina.1